MILLVLVMKVMMRLVLTSLVLTDLFLDRPHSFISFSQLSSTQTFDESVLGNLYF